ncbi:MAG TPA: hypothetical protein VHW09_10155 [Bryobacteraceae bacterium]|jgi:hypothetical protein|nr:hypothetical protein [Bryobacteraceae bacterium]
MTRLLTHYAFLAICCTSIGWGGSIYTFTQVSPIGEPIFTLGGAAINSSGLVAWVDGSSIDTWNGATVSVYNPGVTIISAGSNIGLSDANSVSFAYQSGAMYLAGNYSLSSSTLTSFQYPGQTYTYDGGSSPNGLLVAGDYAGATGFVWQGGTSFTDITYSGPHGQTYVFGVNDSGDVVGLSDCCNLGLSFLDQSGVFTTISVPGYSDDDVQSFNLNNLDTVVGNVWDGTNAHGFIWQNGVASIVDYPGASNTTLYGINSAGVLVGEADFGNNADGIVFEASNAPEPGTLFLMLGAALLAVGSPKFRNRFLHRS